MNYCDFLFDADESTLGNLAIADADNGRRLTYRELQQKVVQLSKFFRSKGFKPGDVILSHLYNSNEAAIVHLAIQYIGGVSCLVDPLFRAHELDYYMKDSGAKLVISHLQKAEIQAVSKVATILMNVFEIEEVLYGEGQVETDVRPDYYQYEGLDLALLLYTSGSTSQPKAVMLPAGCFRVFLQKNNEGMYHYAPTDRILCYAPFSHGFGSISILIPSLAYKAATVFMRSFHPIKVAQSIAKESITHLFGVPTHYQQLLKYEALYPELRKLKAAFCAAAPLNTDTVRQWYDVTGIYLDEGYGMTETCTLITTRMNKLPEPAGNVGVTAKGILQVEVSDDQKKVALVGVIGEIRVKGLGTMLGYLNKPEATAERLQDGWVYTGDLGYKLEDGSLVLCGRKTEFINVAGLKISPVEIEAVLNDYPGVVDSAAIGLENELYGQVVKAFVQLKPGVNSTERELIKYCSEKLASFKAPKTITFLDEFPRNNLGKIDKKALKAMEESLSA
ncbi:MAG TPA: class I adenylate-forming enzyme family protein [Bacillota bacterium]|nr:class I adenylate-forming enzyme family protein [Bacillota bacterium]